MADDQERTEEPTSKRIEDARRDGNVPSSQEIAGWISLFVSTLAIIFLMPYISDNILKLFRYYFSLYGSSITLNLLIEIAINTSKYIMLILLPIIIPIAIAGAGGYLAQFGFIFTTKPLTPDFNKLNPVTGFMNLFSLKRLIEGVKITLKVAVAFFVGMIFFWDYIKELPTVTLFSLGGQLHWLRSKAITIAFLMLGVFLVFAALDLFIKRFQYFSGLKMSKEEVKQEYKEMEGDPHVKARIRRIQMEMSKKRMLSEVPKASVVITNPTHYAVAVKYDKDMDRAPLVVASGVDLVAQKIKEIAREAGVPIYENVKLAQDLYRTVKPGEPIPGRLFQAIAEVLVFVMRSSGQKR